MIPLTLAWWLLSREWYAIGRDFGPAFIALIAVIIASMIQYRQWKTAQDKLKLDLFEKRVCIP
jgi:hypothetical protein